MAVQLAGLKVLEVGVVDHSLEASLINTFLELRA